MPKRNEFLKNLLRKSYEADHAEVRIGTLQSIIRQLGLTRRLFETER
jgi:hypothetical protein